MNNAADLRAMADALEQRKPSGHGYDRDLWAEEKEEFIDTAVMRSAADEIERLRTALVPFANWMNSIDRDGFGDEPDGTVCAGREVESPVTFGDLRRARELLKYAPAKTPQS